MSVPAIVPDDIRTVVRAVGEAFHRLDGKTLFITGGTGFIGSYFLETLAHLNDRVLSRPCRVFVATRSKPRVAERFPHLADRPEFVFLEGDVRGVRPPPVRWDFVIHGAGPSDAKLFLQDPLQTMDTIIEGTRAVLQAASQASPEGILFVSSGAVYGPQPPTLAGLREDWGGGPDLGDPRSCYGEAKRCAELLCTLFQTREGLPISIGRLFTIVGPWQEWNSTSAVIDFLRQGLSGDTITIRGDGSAVRSYCYVADAVTALWKILLACRPGEVLNVGADQEPIAFRDLASRVGGCLGKPVRVVVLGNAEPGVLGDRYVPDIGRLVERTGFRPGVVLDDALFRTATWMQSERRDGTGGARRDRIEGDRTCV